MCYYHYIRWREAVKRLEATPAEFVKQVVMQLSREIELKMENQLKMVRYELMYPFYESLCPSVHRTVGPLVHNHYIRLRDKLKDCKRAFAPPFNQRR